MTKEGILQKIIETVEEQIRGAEGRAITVAQAAIDAPGANQSHSDTTKSQMGRVADELGKSISEKIGALRALQGMIGFCRDQSLEVPITMGSLVELVDINHDHEWYFVLPAGGGTEIPDQGREILVISADSPLTVALLGARVGSKVNLQFGKLQRSLTIVNIQ